jgi:hypothetical protein
MLSAGCGEGAVVPGFVALPGAFRWTVSEVARVLSVAEALSRWEAPLLWMLSGRAVWLSEATGAVLSEAGTCAEVAGGTISGTIKRPNPSNQVVRRVECEDMTALLVDRGAAQSFYS